jgi:hypothetical protein
LFSLRNGPNYKPNYVGITKREFSKECFSNHILVKILDRFARKKGTLYLHLLAKPKDHNVGFSTVHRRALLWSEMFLLLLCRKKNPKILNITGHAFLEDCAIEGITDPCKGRGKNIKTFRNAVGIHSFGMAAGNGKKPTPQATAHPPRQPKAQIIDAPAPLTH